MAYQNILFDVSGPVAEIRLNTPSNFNAMSHAMYVDIQSALDVCRQDDSIRAVLLRANGKAFSGGGDIVEMQDKVSRNDFDTDVLCMDSLRIVQTLRRLPKPVVAAVHGAVAGSGFIIALSCDVMVAEAGSKFYLPFVNIGLIPDASGMYTLTRVLGTSRAVAKAMMGEYFTADEGVELGFVYKKSAADTFEADIERTVQKLAGGPTRAYAGLKRLAYISQFTATSYEDYMQHEIAVQTSMGASQDFREGITAFLEKRSAVFHGR